MKEKLKQLDTKIVETARGLIALALLLLGGVIALAVGLGIPVAIVGSFSRGDFAEVGLYLLVEVIGVYLYRGMGCILKIKGVLG